MKKGLLILFFLFVAVLSVNAENNVVVESVSIENGNMTVGFSSRGIESEEWLTLLVYKADSPDESDTVSNIVSARQFKKGDKISIEFPLNDSLKGTYQVKMGGSGVSLPSVMSVTIDDGMKETLRFINTDINMFIGTVSVNSIIRDENGNPIEFSAGKKYIAATSGVMNLDGYKVREYGIRLNGKDFKAKVTLNNFSRYGVLFKGDAVKDGYEVTAFPYAVYCGADEKEIVCYGNSIVRTVGDKDDSLFEEPEEEPEDNPGAEVNYLFNDKFSSLMYLPPEYSTSAGNFGTVALLKPENDTESYLIAEDITSDSVGALKYSGVNFCRRFSPVAEKFALEFRMKFLGKSNPYMSMTFCIRSENTNITRLLVTSSGGVMVTTSEIGEAFEFGDFLSDVWYKIRMVVEPGKDTYQIMVSCPETGYEKCFESAGCATAAGVNAEYADNFYFDTQVYDGIALFDYIKLELNPGDLSEDSFVHPDKLIYPPLVKAPVTRPIEGRINICLDGEYLYPASELYDENGEIMIYLKNAAVIFGGAYSEDGVLKLREKEFDFGKENEYVTVNGKREILPVSCRIINEKLYIPLIYLAESCGYFPEYNEETNILYLTNGGNGNE